MAKDDDYRLLMKLFVDTFRPYLHMIHMWISQGIIEDPHQEFMIKRYVFVYIYNTVQR